MSDFAGIIWLAVLLLCNAFFVAAEFSIIAAKRAQIEPRAQEGSRSAKTTLWAMEHATLMLACTQLGITICSLLILNVSEPSIHHLLEYVLVWLPEEASGVVAFVITLVLVSGLHVVFGEMVPKNIALSAPDRAALLLAPPLVVFDRVFGPVVKTLNHGADLVLKMCGVTPRHAVSAAFTLDQVATIVEESTREGMLTDNAGTLGNAFEFTSKVASDVAVPAARLVTVGRQGTPADIERAVAKHGYSRYIIVDEDGQPLGYVHLKDVLDLEDEDEFDQPIPVKRYRHLIAVKLGTELEDALALMQRNGAHLVKVVDDHAITVGVLFLEDVIEELVGEVQDATQRD
ncbi:MAG TPA: HlyC/CorC family transporter [Pseudoclavibacter sp.]|nr:HlyC/CorC family transporter [Pseudoclavibacter sp.]